MAEELIHRNDPDLEQVTDEKVGKNRLLILHNDEVHTFDYVIETLIKVCELEPVQAEQCTYLVHYKGKCDVKKGDYNYLKPYKQGLLDRGLQATID
jgi:ATP-dependent Clp protease adaptor protein ClpS